MTFTELLLSALPLVLALVAAILLVWKTGAFSQREHRKRVEALLERIAIAVESHRKL
jgi:predicted membrane protein